MKKLFVTLMVALMSAAMSFGQNTLVATLTHKSDIKAFYGINALQQAHAAAADGDIITLSSGTFQAINITKGVTIRGAGMGNDNPTRIINDFDIELPSASTTRLSIEGCRLKNQLSIKGKTRRAFFNKCYIEYLFSSGEVRNTICVDCNIRNLKLTGNSHIQCLNSRVYNPDIQLPTASGDFINCVITPFNGFAISIHNSKLINTILFYTNSAFYYSSYDDYRLDKSSVAYNCVAIGDFGSVDMFENASIHQQCFNTNDNFFIDLNLWNGLNDEAKKKYVGTDGTEIGMFGGAFPYDETPSYPQITKMNVASKTTSDGKLSVEIEVSAKE